MNYDTYIYLSVLYNWYMWLTYSQISVEQTCLKRSEEERETADVPHIAALYSVVILSVYLYFRYVHTDLCWGWYFHCLWDWEIWRETNKGIPKTPAGENPPQCSQDPCGDPSHSLRLNSDPPLAKSQNDPRPPLRRGPSHLPGNISWPPT